MVLSQSSARDWNEIRAALAGLTSSTLREGGMHDTDQ